MSRARRATSLFLDADHGTGGPYDLLLVVEGLLGMLFCKYIEVGLADQFAGSGKPIFFAIALLILRKRLLRSLK